MDEGIKALLGQSALDQNLLAAMGRITANFAILELNLIKLIYFLLGSDEETALIVASEKSFSGLQDLAMALIIKHVKNKVLNADLEKEFRKISSLVSQNEQERNTISHSLFGSASELGRSKTIRTKYTAKRKKGLIFHREEMHLEDFKKIYDSISVSSFEVNQFSKKILLSLKIAGVEVKGIDKSRLAIL